MENKVPTSFAENMVFNPKSTVINWLLKYGNFDREDQTPSHMKKISEQRIMELEAEVNLLKKQNPFLERQVYVAYKKVIISILQKKFTTRTIDNFRSEEKEYNLQLRIVRVG